MAMFNFTRKDPTEGYSAEDKSDYNTSKEGKSKAGKRMLGRAVAVGFFGLASYCSFTDIKGVPREYARLEQAQNYFDGLVSAIDYEPQLLNSMSSVSEVAEFRTQFKTQDFSAQRAFARDAHYSLQRKMDESGFDKDGHQSSNAFNVFAGLLLGYFVYSSTKKGSKATMEFFDSRKKIKGLEDKYEKIAEEAEAERQEKMRQKVLSEEQSQNKGGR